MESGKIGVESENVAVPSPKRSVLVHCLAKSCTS